MSSLINKNTPEIKAEISKGDFETIYGINIWSRYDDDAELHQMLQFCKYIKKIGMEEYIQELFYNSKINICSIQTNFEGEGFLLELEAIRTMAILTIRQFEIKGVIGHMNPFLSSTIKFTI